MATVGALLSTLPDLDEDVVEYLISVLADAAEEAREESGGPLSAEQVGEIILPFVEALEGVDKADIATLGVQIAAIMAQPADSPIDASVEVEPQPEPQQPPQQQPEYAPEPEPELDPTPAEAAAAAAAADEDPTVAFLSESFPSLSRQDIRGVLKKNRGEVDDRAFELLLQLSDRRAAGEAEAADEEGADGSVRLLGADGSVRLAGKEKAAVSKRDEAKRRRALLERYENAASSAGTYAPRRNATGGTKTVHGRHPTKAQAAREKAAENRSKVRYHNSEVVTRTGEKTSFVKLTKEEEEAERALEAATSVNLAYKSSKGRRHGGR
jgi:hypothetical protein